MMSIVLDDCGQQITNLSKNSNWHAKQVHLQNDLIDISFCLSIIKNWTYPRRNEGPRQDNLHLAVCGS
jgi:hypothetical protein